MSRSLAAGAIAALAVTVVVPSAGAADRLLAPVGQCPGQSAPGASPGTQEAAMRCLVRYARRAAGLRVGRAVAQLDRSAQGKADLIARCHVMEHDACGRPWNGVFRAAGYNGLGAENLAGGSGRYRSARAAMSMWLASPGHRAALLDPPITGYGVGVRLRARLRGWTGSVWVLHLGRPRTG